MTGPVNCERCWWGECDTNWGRTAEGCLCCATHTSTPQEPPPPPRLSPIRQIRFVDLLPPLIWPPDHQEKT